MTAVIETPAAATEGYAGYRGAAELDLRLGDPRDEANPYGFAAMVTRDAVEAFPVKLAAAVAPELSLGFVPAEHGGRLTTVDESLMKVRVAARRDVTVMPATMFSITAATCVLLAGDERQREQVVRLLAAGRAIGFALSEQEHGSDLLANACLLLSAESVGGNANDDTDANAGGNDNTGGFVLAGSKWLVGLGDRCDLALVIGRSGGRGPAAFTAVLVGDDVLRDARGDSWQRPAGMRGIDFAGFAFHRAEVPAGAVVGRVGHGMETAMKAMQYVRVFSTAANLACADTGLRLAMDFAGRHQVAGQPVREHRSTRRELATAAAALLGCDAVALATARMLHTSPGAASVTGSVAKKVLTDGSAEVFDRCAGVLGTRSLLRDGQYAAFEVTRRDNAVVRHIDTSPVANLRLVAMQLGQWASQYDPRPDPFAVTESLAAAFTLDADLPPLHLDQLDLSTRGHDEVTAAVPFVAAAARAAIGDEHGDDRTVLRLCALETALTELRDAVVHGKQRFGAGFGGSPEQLDLAERFCFLHAAASCLHLWWCNRHRWLFGTEPGSTGWLCAALSHLLARADGLRTGLDPDDTEAAFAVAAAMHHHGQLFSAVAVPLAEAATDSARSLP